MSNSNLFTLKKGETWGRKIVRTTDGVTPIDLTDYTALMQLRLEAGATVILELTSANSTIQIVPLTGEIFLTLTPAQTEELPVGRVQFDLRMTKNSIVEYALEGYILITNTITKPA